MVLKGLETANTALLGEDRRDGETLFDLDASVPMRADEWDRIWLRDKAELPRLYQALHTCRAEAAKAEHVRPPISDGARPDAFLRNKRGSALTIGRHLSSRLCLMWRSRAWLSF